MLNLTSPDEILHDVAARARARRLAFGLTQRDLADRSGVKIDSLRRFERTGLAAFEAVVKIAVVLDALDGLEALFPTLPFQSIDEVVAEPRRRQRARKAVAR